MAIKLTAIKPSAPTNTKPSLISPLSEDVTIHIFSFLNQYDLHTVRLVNKRIFALAMKDFLWKTLSNNLIRAGEKFTTKGLTWYQIFKVLASYRFDLLEYSENLKLTNNMLHSTSCNAWGNARLAKLMKPGRIYKWKVKIVESQHKSDSWYIITGIEIPSFPWHAKSNSDVIGFTVNRGYGFLPVLGMKIHTSYKPTKYKENTPWVHMLKAGDVIGVEFDMRYSSPKADESINEIITKYSYKDYKICVNDPNHRHHLSYADVSVLESTGARLTYYLNNTCLGVAYYGISGQEFYPAFSVTGIHKLSVHNFCDNVK